MARQQESGEALRRWTRYKIDIRLKVSFPGDSKQGYAFGRANSLSRGGIGAYIPVSIPVGTIVNLEMTFPYSTKEARLEAVIRTCEGFRYGLEFTRVPDEIQALLVKSCSAAELLH
jgi:hypothetical protein